MPGADVQFAPPFASLPEFTHVGNALSITAPGIYMISFIADPSVASHLSIMSGASVLDTPAPKKGVAGLLLRLPSDQKKVALPAVSTLRNTSPQPVSLGASGCVFSCSQV